MNARTQKLMDVKEQVFTSWVNLVRAHVSKAQKLPEPLLIDTLPAFYDALVDVATGRAPAYRSSTLALEHGSERARLTHFDSQSIVQEFQLFRQIVFSTWDQLTVGLSLAEMASVNHAIDQAIAESISGFVMIEERFRSQFFSALAHDMRTPLATAAMAVEMIAQSDDRERIQTMVGIANKQHNLLSQMIVDLLDTVVAASGADISPQFKPADMLAIANEVAEAAQLAFARTVLVRGESIKGSWCEASIRRALDNLVNNAIKYGTGDTEVVVDLAQFHGRCIVSVENTGAPIPTEQQETIFQLFRRREQALQPNTIGWGIGLPFVRSVAEQHGGSIGITSTDTKTTFIFDIPLDPAGILEVK